jgi:transcriptional regulator with XRE-family HTH domain
MHVLVPRVPKDSLISPELLDAALAACPKKSAADIAEALGVHETTISRWRRGERDLARIHWLAILSVLGLPTDWQPTKSSPKAAKRGRGRPRKAKPRA